MEALEAARIPKAIATSSGRRFTRNVLSRFDWESRFQFVLTSEDIKQGKPNPEIYLTAVERFGLQPAEVMVLEDSQNGCRAAVAAGKGTSLPSPAATLPPDPRVTRAGKWLPPAVRRSCGPRSPRGWPLARTCPGRARG
jgi:phosphoglycolate phosphatase-like HAD superfamily hydrolase